MLLELTRRRGLVVGARNHAHAVPMAGERLRTSTGARGLASVSILGKLIYHRYRYGGKRLLSLHRQKNVRT